MYYSKISIEDCFIYYHTSQVACECNSDEKIVVFKKEN